MEDLTIFVPSTGRVGRCDTLKYLLDANQKVVVVTSLGEEKEYRRFYQAPVIAGPKGIAATRQHILESCDTPFCAMIDDDMTFFERDKDKKLKKLEGKKVSRVIHELEVLISKGFKHGGISARQGNNRVEEDHRVNTRINNFHFFHCDTVKKYVRFDDILVMEDFWVTLHLLTNGIPNVCSFQCAWNQRRSGAKGGCSSYRTLRMQELSALRLQKRFPDYVKLVTKTTKGSGIFDGERTDVRIQWRKAFTPRKRMILGRKYHASHPRTKCQRCIQGRDQAHLSARGKS